MSWHDSCVSAPAAGSGGHRKSQTGHPTRDELHHTGMWCICCRWNCLCHLNYLWIKRHLTLVPLFSVLILHIITWYLLSSCRIAAAPGSPALPASGSGAAHDPSPPRPQPTGRPPRCHLQLRPLLALQHPRLSSPAGQRGQEHARDLRQPPRGRRRQVRLVARHTCSFILSSPKARRRAEALVHRFSLFSYNPFIFPLDCSWTDPFWFVPTALCMYLYDPSFYCVTDARFDFIYTFSCLRVCIYLYIYCIFLMLVVKVVFKMALMDHRPFGNNGVKLAPFVFFLRAHSFPLKIVHLVKLQSEALWPPCATSEAKSNLDF